MVLSVASATNRARETCRARACTLASDSARLIEMPAVILGVRKYPLIVVRPCLNISTCLDLCLFLSLTGFKTLLEIRNENWEYRSGAQGVEPPC